MIRTTPLLILLALCIHLGGCKKEVEDEDADAGEDAVDTALDPTDEDTTVADTTDDTAVEPDAIEDPPTDVHGDTLLDTGEDAELDTATEPDGAAHPKSLVFTVTPAAEGLDGSAVHSEENPESVVFDTDTALPTHTPGTNAVYIDAASLGLADADDVDAISFLAGPPPYSPTFFFSVEDLESHDEGMPDSALRDQSDGEDDPGDVYSSAGDDENALAFDEVSLGLTPDPAGGTPKDDLNGLELTGPSPASGPLYFSVKPGAVGLADTAVADASAIDLPGTVFVSELDGDNAVAFTRDELGLLPNDDVDALVVFGTMDTPRYVHFSVTAASVGSPGTAVNTQRTLDGAAGDVFASAGSYSNTLVADAMWLGLLPEGTFTQDEMDALVDFGPSGDFDQTVTGEGLHSFDGTLHPFLRGGSVWAVADFLGEQVTVHDAAWALQDTWDLSPNGVFDVAIASTGDAMAACTVVGLQWTCFPPDCMTIFADSDQCFQVISHRGHFWTGSMGTSWFNLVSFAEDGASPATTTALSAQPWGLASFNNRIFVVTDPGTGDGALLVYDVSGATPTYVNDVTVGAGPRFVAVNSQGTLAAVTNSTDGTVSIVDLFSLTETDAVTVGTNPFGVAALADVVAVANYDDSTISIVDMSSATVLDTIDVSGCSPGFVKRVPGTSHVAAACYTSGDLSFTDLSPYL